MTTIKAFTTQQVTGLAKISERQLRYWEETDVFSPTFVNAVMPGPYRKIYSFRDLVTLRTLGLLRNQHGVVLDELRRTSRYLRAHPESSWPALGLRLHGHHVAFRDPESGEWVSAEPLGQRVLPLDLDEIVRESARAAQGLFSRSPEEVGKVTRNRNVMSNAPVFAGTRIPVDAVLSLKRAGYTNQEILCQYPTLQSKDLATAMRDTAVPDAA